MKRLWQSSIAKPTAARRKAPREQSEAELGGGPEAALLTRGRVCIRPSKFLLWNQSLAVLRKDLLLEWHGRSRIFAVFGFAVTILLLFSFAAGPDGSETTSPSTSFLWLALLFASVLSLSESLRVEVEDDALQSLLLLPVDPIAFFIGKAVANALLLIVLSIVLIPLALGIFDATVRGSWWMLIAFLGLGCTGLAAPGTLYAAMTARLGGRDVMLPLLFFPLIIPVLIATVKGSSFALLGDAMNQAQSWLAVLLIFNLVYWALCPLLLGRVIDE